LIPARIVPDPPEGIDSLFTEAFGRSRIDQAPVDPRDIHGEIWALVPRAVAERDNVIEILVEISPYILRLGGRDVDAELLEGEDCDRVDPVAGPRTGAHDVDGSAGAGPQDSFSHLAPSLIPRAEEEYFLLCFIRHIV
jgi:hypothetical protein